MPRQSRSRPAPRAAPAPAPSSQQTRSAHTASYPTGAAAPPMAPPAPPAAAAGTQGKQPGMIAQMAATAGSVAVGSTIGHGISNMLFGSSHPAQPAPEQAPPVEQRQQQAMSCDFQSKQFTECLKTSDVQGCSWYLEQLKACQAAASQY